MGLSLTSILLTICLETPPCVTSIFFFYTSKLNISLCAQSFTFNSMSCTIMLTQTCNFPWIHSVPHPDKNCAMPYKWEECNMPLTAVQGSSHSEGSKDYDSDGCCFPQAWHHDWEQNYLHSATVELLTNSNNYIRLYKQQTSIYIHNRNSILERHKR